MSDGSIEDALKITLADYRLTRGEKRALAKVIEKIGDDDQQLAYARNVAFKLVREQLGGANDAELIDWLENVLKVLVPREDSGNHELRSEAFFSPDDACVGKINRLFTSSRKSVDVCVFTITDDRIKDAILAAHRRGVAIRIISDNDKSTDLGSDIDQLARLGVPVRVDRTEYHMHHKFAIFDRSQLLTGSYNWTRSAARNNEENFIVTGDRRLLKSFRVAFDKLWKELGG
ncbi:phospholipase D-like domain-containing protein [Stieleria mannarensis]|uniref:phospholipase D-like domain-containing protein n=1 Tax=Stieleria mannarensis TaxID=2755585 RepID=UPI001600ADC3|nr:phospholipase D-like domain-containing protein [Rhodopirellula sp. JC639]